MTAGHLVVAAATTAYILAAVRSEEGDLIRSYGDAYRPYRQRVPMLLPLRLVGGPPRGIAAGRGVEAATGRSLPKT